MFVVQTADVFLSSLLSHLSEQRRDAREFFWRKLDVMIRVIRWSIAIADVIEETAVDAAGEMLLMQSIHCSRCAAVRVCVEMADDHQLP